MCTPTGHQVRHPTGTPSQQHQQHLSAFSSPAPRSVPSPAAPRSAQQTAKSPVHSGSGTSTAASASMNPPTISFSSSFKPFLGSSPSAAMGAASFGSPSAMNMGLNGVVGLDGGIGMGISMSGISALGLDLGLGSSMGGRPDDTERRRRLEAILATLESHPGRVSRTGIERLARRLGLSIEVMSDYAASQHYAGDDRQPQQQLLLAHTSFMLDVAFRENKVVGVALQFDDLCESAQRYAASAGTLLKADLQPRPGEASINLSLNRFSDNLERLTRMDKLSSPQDEKPQVNCFEAIAKMYFSLERLFKHERNDSLRRLFELERNATLNQSKSHIHERAAREVLCKRSGRPKMNANSIVGLSLDYWMDKRLLFQGPDESQDGSQNTDITVDDEGGQYDESANRIFSLSIECESCPAHLYRSIRVSDEWISDAVERPLDPDDLFTSPVIDWLDPPPTYAGGSEGAHDDPMGSNGISKLPNVRFVAKLNPPLAIPLNTMQNILDSVNVQMNQESLKWSASLEALILQPNHSSAVGLPTDITKEYHNTRNVFVVGKDGREHDKPHQSTLYVNKTEVACLLEDIPFEHPRQLVEILPMLRQYAHLTTLLQSTLQPRDHAPQNGTITTTSPETAIPSTSAFPLSIYLAGIDTSAPIISVTYPHPHSSAFGQSTSEKIDSVHDLLNSIFLTSTKTSEDCDIGTDIGDKTGMDHFRGPDSDASADNEMPLSGLFDPVALAPTVTLAATILPNADVTMYAQDLLPELHHVSGKGMEGGSGQAKHDSRESDKWQGAEASRAMELGKMGRALELCSDIGVWVEWVADRIEVAD